MWKFKDESTYYVAQFAFKFVSNMSNIHEEILVMDSIGLLGSLGGSLGLFIGFSFYGYFDQLIEVIMAKIVERKLKLAQTQVPTTIDVLDINQDKNQDGKWNIKPIVLELFFMSKFIWMRLCFFQETFCNSIAYCKFG